jgi:repressor LexA
MTDPVSARTYLAKALDDAGIHMKVASEGLGLNHAYLQQYITRGKPRWLPEAVREGLKQLLPLDEEKLKPPPTKARLPRRASHSRPNRGDKSQIDTPRYGKFVDDPGQLDLLEVWDAIRPDMRDLAMRILRNMADASGSVVA